MAVDVDRFDPDQDGQAVNRLWAEIDWVSESDEPQILTRFLSTGRADVARIDGEAECVVHRVPGAIRYQDGDLPLCAVTAVTVSPLARRRGLATALTAAALTGAAREGAAVAALGVFDQGFYDRLGFGSAGYATLATFDPARLVVDHVAHRPPVRLTAADHAEIHDLLRRRHRRHGGVVLDPPDITRSELEWDTPSLGLGFRHEGRLTHALFGKRKGESGPHRINLLAYEQPHQVLELFRALHELGDQTLTVKLFEPPDLQLQDLLATPFRDRFRTIGSEHATGLAALAWWQLRIVDLGATVASLRSPYGPLRFNLTLTDPVTERVADGPAAPGASADPAGPWPGIAGRYVVTIGPESSVEPGTDPGADRLTASVNAFSRLWFGVRPASSLALTDQLSGPPALLDALDRAVVVAPPVAGLQF